MEVISQILYRFRALFRQRQLETDLHDEIRFHVEMQTEENIHRGMNPAEARTAALRRFGGTEQIKERCRDQRRFTALEDFWRDLCYGARSLSKSPALAAIVVFTLALAIGANTAIFSVLNTVVLQPLPYPNPDRLVMLWEQDRVKGIDEQMVSGPSVVQWCAHNRSFEDIGFVANGSIGTRSFVLGQGDDAWRIEGRFASAGTFMALGVSPLLGRTFSPAEDERGEKLVAVLSHSFWQQYCAGDPNAIGQTLRLSNGNKPAPGIFSWNRQFTIIGVMPPGFRFPPDAEFWLSFSGHPWFNPDRISPSLWSIGRLKPGVAPHQAAAELSVLQGRFAQERPESPEVCSEVTVVPLHQQANGPGTETALLTLFGAVVFVLLIACANVANLLLARGAVRQKEIAVRIALGAGRWRVVRQLLTESLLLALAGGACGLLIANWGVQLLPDFRINSVASAKEFRIDRFQDVRLNWQVLGFSLLICLGTSLIVGLLPALQSSRVNVNESLTEEGRSSTGSVRRHRLRRLLLVSEVALAMVLLIGAGLMMRSFWRLQQVDPGIESERVLKATVDLAMSARAFSGGPHERMRQLVEQAHAIPGVESAAAMAQIPLLKGSSPISLIFDGEEAVHDRPSYPAHKHIVSPGTFRTLGIPLLRGRDFNEHDDLNSPPVVVINRALADRFFHGENPIGKKIMPHPYGWPVRGWVGLEIIGVVGDVRHFDLSAEISPEVYTCHLQLPERYWNRATLTVRTTGDPLAMFAALRRKIEGEKLRGRILTDFETIEGILEDSLAAERFSAALLLLFAGVAVVLASTGIYGVVSYSAAQRTQEFGIRMALGAQPSHVLRLILSEGLGLSLMGVVIGLAICLAGTRLLASRLYGIEPTDPATYAALASLLVLVALLASYLPARRATRVDPMVALRYE